MSGELGREGMRTDDLGAELDGFVEAFTGPVAHLEDLSWDHGESMVWRVASSTRQALLKVHRQGRKFANEVTAYTRWLPLLRPALEAGSRAPELLALRSEHPRALLLSWEPGELLESSELPRPLENSSHRRAGRFLRALHDLPVRDDDGLPLAEAYQARLASWARRTAGVVEDTVIDAVVAEAALALPFIETCSRVPCHRDFTPRNWLVHVLEPNAHSQVGNADAHTSLVVIDFEHARPDLYLVDLQRLWVGLWRRRPDLRASFLEGYGRQLTADEERALRQVSALWALSTVGWAREHGDSEFEHFGREVLEWLGLT